MVSDSLPFLVTGAIFGLAAGISPGPLLALVISETLRHSRKAGIFVAIAPLVTDVPIVLVSVLVLTKLANSHLIGVISLLGALFIGYLAYESISVKGMDLESQTVKAQSFKRGIVANFLNPNPYLFWIGVGAPTVLKAYKVNVFSVLLFIAGFYVLLVGSKIIVALLVDKSRTFLKSNVYIYTMRLLGLILLIFALLFVRDGLQLLGVL